MAALRCSMGRGPARERSPGVKVARIALAVYVVFILAVIAAADLGGTDAVFSRFVPFPFFDKIGHFVLIGVLALLVDLALDRKNVWRHVPLGPAIVVVLVVLEELSQLLMIMRTFDLLDLTADLSGIAFFVAMGRRTPRAASSRDRSASPS